MSDDLSPLHPRMRRPAIISLVSGFGLGVLAVQAHRITSESGSPWILAIPLGALAALMLYAKMYRAIANAEEVS